MNRKRQLIILLLIFIGLVLGFFQEFIKINLNFIIESGSKIPGFFEADLATKKAWIAYFKSHGPIDFYHSPTDIDLLYNLSLHQLNMLKWLLTVVFTIVYLIINLLLIKRITESAVTSKWMLIFYIVLFVLAFAIFLIGKMIGFSEETYSISRKIVGALQSLIPLMILVPTFWLSKKMHEKN